MKKIRIVSNLEECRAIWQEVMPRHYLTDLWEVRDCFQNHFGNRPHFVLAEDGNGIQGLLPLSWISDCGCYGFFPGETWQGKTWLEQNRIICNGNGGLVELLSGCSQPYHLRYLTSVPGTSPEEAIVDEVGYLFLPPNHGYDMSQYLGEFSRKSMKNIFREMSTIESLGVTYRHDEISDFDIMVKLNMERFGRQSYFFDPRFREGFRALAWFLHERGWLRFTTVLINDEQAAVDMGCIYRGVYTLLAGGTNSRYPGVAKLINFHHMQRACKERLDQVDFLCGNFNWKRLFHLTPRPLYLLADLVAKAT
ncbi:MAG: GNAT family N-acetyltransferase [Thermodesulfobacteriota bacterium]